MNRLISLFTVLLEGKKLQNDYSVGKEKRLVIVKSDYYKGFAYSHEDVIYA